MMKFQIPHAIRFQHFPERQAVEFTEEAAPEPEIFYESILVYPTQGLHDSVRYSFIGQDQFYVIEHLDGFSVEQMGDVFVAASDYEKESSEWDSSTLVEFVERVSKAFERFFIAIMIILNSEYDLVTSHRVQQWHNLAFLLEVIVGLEREAGALTSDPSAFVLAVTKQRLLGLNVAMLFHKGTHFAS